MSASKMLLACLVLAAALSDAYQLLPTRPCRAACAPSRARPCVAIDEFVVKRLSSIKNSYDALTVRGHGPRPAGDACHRANLPTLT